MYRKWTTFKWNCLGCRHHVSSQFFSFVVFMFPIRGCRVRFLVWSLRCHCVQVATSIQNRVLRVCSHPLFNVHLGFVVEERGTRGHQYSRYLLPRGCRSPPARRSTRQHAAPRSEAFKTAKSPSQYLHRKNFSIPWQKCGILNFAQKCRKGQTGHRKRTHLPYERNVSACVTSAGNKRARRGRFSSLFAGTCQEWLKVPQVLILGLQTDSVRGGFANMESAIKEASLYLYNLSLTGSDSLTPAFSTCYHQLHCILKTSTAHDFTERQPCSWLHICSNMSLRFINTNKNEHFKQFFHFYIIYFLPTTYVHTAFSINAITNHMTILLDEHKKRWTLSTSFSRMWQQSKFVTKYLVRFPRADENAIYCLCLWKYNVSWVLFEKMYLGYHQLQLSLRYHYIINFTISLKR